MDLKLTIGKDCYSPTFVLTISNQNSVVIGDLNIINKIECLKNK